MADVFISYAHGDSSIANELAHEFKARGISVFFDQALAAGTDFRQEIAQALTSAKVVIVLLSENTRRSSWVQEEISSLIERTDGPKVLSILLDEHAKENWVWPLISNRQTFDLSSHPEKLTEIVPDISKILSSNLVPLRNFYITPIPTLIIVVLATTVLVTISMGLVLRNPTTSAQNNFPPQPELWGLIGAAAGGVIGYIFSRWRK